MEIRSKELKIRKVIHHISSLVAAEILMLGIFLVSVDMFLFFKAEQLHIQTLNWFPGLIFPTYLAVFHLECILSCYFSFLWTLPC